MSSSFHSLVFEEHAMPRGLEMNSEAAQRPSSVHQRSAALGIPEFKSVLHKKQGYVQGACGVSENQQICHDTSGILAEFYKRKQETPVQRVQNRHEEDVQGMATSIFSEHPNVRRTRVEHRTDSIPMFSANSSGVKGSVSQPVQNDPAAVNAFLIASNNNHQTQATFSLNYGVHERQRQPEKKFTRSFFEPKNLDSFY